MASDSSGKKADYEIGYGKPPLHTQFKKGMRRSRKPSSPKPEDLIDIFKRVCSEKARVREGDRERLLTVGEAVLVANRNLALKQKANGLRNMSLMMDRHQEAIDPARIGGQALAYEIEDNKTPEQIEAWADARNEEHRVRWSLEDLKAKYGLSDHPSMKDRYRKPSSDS